MSFSGVWFPKIYQARHVKVLFQLPTPATKHGHTNVCIEGVKNPSIIQKVVAHIKLSKEGPINIYPEIYLVS